MNKFEKELHVKELHVKELENIREAKKKCKKCALRMDFKVECSVEDTKCNEDCTFLKFLQEN